MNFDEDEDDCCQCGNGLAGFEGLRFQKGFGLSGFEGVRYQKGFGLLGNLFAKAWPYLKQFGKYIGKKLLGLGVDVASDVVLDGKPIKESVKERAKSSAKVVAKDGMNKIQELLQKVNGRRRAAAKRKIKLLKRKPNKSCRKMKLKKSNKRRKTSRRKSKTPSLSFLA